MTNHKISHYHLESTKPFQNILNAPEGERINLLKSVSALNSSKRKFGNRYIDLRLKTEKKLYNMFVARGKTPLVKHPVYFVLSESNWFKGLSDDHVQIKMELFDLDINQISITYPDSFVSMGFMPEFGMEVEAKNYHNKVYLPDELDDLINKFGMPLDHGDYDNYQNQSFEKYIEIQYWGKLQIHTKEN